MTNPYLAGFRSRCPRCGEGKLFAGYLTVAPRCDHCGLDLAEIDTGDGPAFFVVLVVGAIVAPLALALETLKQPPYWVHAVIWGPLTLGLIFALLPAFKGVLVAAHYAQGHGTPPGEA